MAKESDPKVKDESIDRDGFGPSTVRDEVVLEIKTYKHISQLNGEQ